MPAQVCAVYQWVLQDSFSWTRKYWQPVGFVAQSTDVAILGNVIDNTARCPYGNFGNPFEVLIGTVTNLTID